MNPERVSPEAAYTPTTSFEHLFYKYMMNLHAEQFFYVLREDVILDSI